MPNLEEALARLEVLINEGGQRISRQRELVAELARLGIDTALARKLLDKFEDVQRAHLAKRDELLPRWEDFWEAIEPSADSRKLEGSQSL